MNAGVSGLRRVKRSRWSALWTASMCTGVRQFKGSLVLKADGKAMGEAFLNGKTSSFTRKRF